MPVEKQFQAPDPFNPDANTRFFYSVSGTLVIRTVVNEKVRETYVSDHEVADLISFLKEERP